ncbi:MAG: diaminopimelate epimerase [Clostridiales bacterium]|nr:diaminopimelate epimerase [Clostridiales bacterium]
MKLKYTKMQGLGNDFIIIDNREYKYTIEQLQKITKRVCSRKLSIGADGLMAVEKAEGLADFKMRFFNADGSIGEMCGNGARCITRYAYVNNIAKKNMIFETTAGNVKGEVINGRLIAVTLNNPEIIEFDKIATIDGIDYTISYVELGNPGLPHGIIEYKGLENIARKDIFELGKNLRYHNIFPKGANINFYEIDSRSSAIVRTFERGVEDFTLACGTGSASVAVILYLQEIIKGNKIKISSPGGDLFVEIETDENEKINKLLLIGDTNIVSEGVILDEDINI